MMAIRNYTLSYVITTRNKLPLLREVMKRLLAEVREDEEVVVVDGGSGDGTVEFLMELHREGKIEQFLSEPDRSQGHGINKGLLMARGEVIKILTDDDAFFYPGIRACRNFMLNNGEVDFLSTEGAGTAWNLPDPFGKSAYQHDYMHWATEKVPFGFCDLGLMLRRASLPLLGLYNSAFMRADAEYSFRLTSGPGRLAWYTGACWVRIINPQSNTALFSERVRIEGKRLAEFYLRISKPEQPFNDLRISAFEAAKAALRPAVRALRPAVRLPFQAKKVNEVALPGDWPSVFDRCDRWLEQQNKEHTGNFILESSSMHI